MFKCRIIVLLLFFRLSAGGIWDAGRPRTHELQNPGYDFYFIHLDSQGKNPTNNFSNIHHFISIYPTLR